LRSLHKLSQSYRESSGITNEANERSRSKSETGWYQVLLSAVTPVRCPVWDD